MCCLGVRGQVGARGEIILKSQNRISLREHARDGELQRSGWEPTLANIKAAMDAELLRVKDLMTALGRNSDGAVTKLEFRQVLPLLGFDAGGYAALDAIFDTFDVYRVRRGPIDTTRHQRGSTTVDS